MNNIYIYVYVYIYMYYRLYMHAVCNNTPYLIYTILNTPSGVGHGNAWMVPAMPASLFREELD